MLSVDSSVLISPLDDNIRVKLLLQEPDAGKVLGMSRLQPG